MPSQSSLLGGWQAFGHMADHRSERQLPEEGGLTERGREIPRCARNDGGAPPSHKGKFPAFLQSITQIAPPRIHHLDQRSFRGPPPALDFLLPRNGSPGRHCLSNQTSRSRLYRRANPSASFSS